MKMPEAGWTRFEKAQFWMFAVCGARPPLAELARAAEVLSGEIEGIGHLRGARVLEWPLDRAHGNVDLAGLMEGPAILLRAPADRLMDDFLLRQIFICCGVDSSGALTLSAESARRWLFRSLAGHPVGEKWGQRLGNGALAALTPPSFAAQGDHIVIERRAEGIDGPRARRGRSRAGLGTAGTISRPSTFERAPEGVFTKSSARSQKLHTSRSVGTYGQDSKV